MVTQIELGGIVLDVIKKDIKNVHLSVYPPTGRVRISAPLRMNTNNIRLFAISKLDWRPKPAADVVRGAYNNPDIGGTDLMRDAAAAYSHAIQWYVTGEQPRADKAIEILSA